MNPKILVLGAGGQLGREIQHLCKDVDFEFTFVTRQYLDITDYSKLLAFAEDLKPDWIINCAAFTNVDLAEIEKSACWATNTQGPKNIALICAMKKIGLIHISTDSVFSTKIPIFNEISDTTNPINEYSRSKVAGERAIIDNTDDYWIIRTAWLYGKNGRNFVNSIVAKLKARKPFDVVDDQFGQPTWTQDVAHAIFGILVSVVKPGILHIAAPNIVSRLEWARSIAKISQNSDSLIIPSKSTENELIAKRPKYSLISPSIIEGTKNSWLNPPEISLSKYFAS